MSERVRVNARNVRITDDVDECDRRSNETRRKLEMALATLAALVESKSKNRAWGTIKVRLSVVDGYVKQVDVTDKTTVRDVGE
jgi:acyl-homoserine lactone acylase PvdQ